mmetsp:Transcript_79123/g.256525  ORF Transcript_79123/g.256525 Transcript_79123/m.256525 type:complete len:485 (-) Transcript_79123:262-1716(-)
MVRVDIALVPGVLREVRIHVIVHWELSPSRGCQRLADPSSQHAQLRVAPPESCQPWARPNRLNELLERRTNLHVVRGQGHGVVPSANLVFERGLVRGPDLALQGVPVQPGPLQVIVCLFAQEALALTHEAQEGSRTAHFVSLALELDVLEIAIQGDGLVQHIVVVSPRAIQIHEELPGAQDPGGLPQLREGVAGREEKRQSGDLREVDHEALVLAAAQAASVAQHIAAQPRCSDVHDDLSVQAAGHEVLARTGSGRRHATLARHLRNAIQRRCTIVVLADAEPGIRQRRAGSDATGRLHRRRVSASRHHQQGALLPVFERGVGGAGGDECDHGLCEAACPRARVHEARQAVVIFLSACAHESLRDDVAHLPPGVGNIVARANLVIPRRWHRHDRTVSAVEGWVHEQVLIHPLRNANSIHNLAFVELPITIPLRILDGSLDCALGRCPIERPKELARHKLPVGHIDLLLLCLKTEHLSPQLSRTQ